MPVVRQLVSGYLSRVVEGESVRSAVADSLGLSKTDIVLGDADADPVVFVEVTPEGGEFPTRVIAFVDAARTPAFTGKPRLLADLARRLGASVLYDDGGSTSPYRWVRVDPDGRRYEVFEDTTSDDLRLDPSEDAQLLDEAIP